MHGDFGEGTMTIKANEQLREKKLAINDQYCWYQNKEQRIQKHLRY
jgi:hypothetical protein